MELEDILRERDSPRKRTQVGGGAIALFPSPPPSSPSYQLNEGVIECGEDAKTACIICQEKQYIVTCQTRTQGLPRSEVWKKNEGSR